MSHTPKSGTPRPKSFAHACMLMTDIAVPAYMFYGACSALFGAIASPIAWVVGLPGGVATIGALVVSCMHRRASCPACAPLGDVEALAAIRANPRVPARYHTLWRHPKRGFLASIALVLGFVVMTLATDANTVAAAMGFAALGATLLYVNLVTRQHQQVLSMCPQCP